MWIIALMTMTGKISPILSSSQHHLLSVFSTGSSFTVPWMIKYAYQPVTEISVRSALATLLCRGLVENYQERRPQWHERHRLTKAGIEALAADKRIPRVFAKVTPVRLNILGIIEKHGPCYGKKIATIAADPDIAKSIYAYLSMMADLHLVQKGQDDKGRTNYDFTALGKRAVKDAADCPPATRSELLILGSLVAYRSMDEFDLFSDLEDMIEHSTVMRIILKNMVKHGLVAVNEREFYEPTEEGETTYRFWVAD
jgi:DNA-binding PadR family transcriptional regulator